MADNGVECSWDYDELDGDDSGWIEYKEPEVKTMAFGLNSEGKWQEYKQRKEYGTAPVEGIRWMTPLPQWIPCSDRMPGRDDKGTIAVLVNGHVFIGSVLVNTNTCFNYLTENERFVFLIDTSSCCEFLPRGKWQSDARFAEPTHWMKIPPKPEECK